MKNKLTVGYGIIAVILMIAMVFTACKKDPPEEDHSEEFGISYWQDPGSSANLDSLFVDSNGVATVKTSGTADDGWKITVNYKYTFKANSSYIYKIEAWKESGTGRILVQYYTDNTNRVYKSYGFEPTTTQTEYTIYGERLPGKFDQIEFHCAGLIGTFYFRVVSIEEYEIGALTITNFRSNSPTPSLLTDKWTTGWAEFGTNDEERIMFADGFSIPTSGNSVTVGVFSGRVVEVLHNDWHVLEPTTPYKGNLEVAAKKLWICQWGEDYEAFYTNKSSITFTNGNASINFGTDMEKNNGDRWVWEEEEELTNPELPIGGGGEG